MTFETRIYIVDIHTMYVRENIQFILKYAKSEKSEKIFRIRNRAFLQSKPNFKQGEAWQILNNLLLATYLI